MDHDFTQKFTLWRDNYRNSTTDQSSQRKPFVIRLKIDPNACSQTRSIYLFTEPRHRSAGDLGFASIELHPDSEMVDLGTEETEVWAGQLPQIGLVGSALEAVFDTFPGRMP